MSSPFWKTFRLAVPLAFVGGCCIELFMIHVRVGSETFYDTAKRKEVERRLERLRNESAIQSFPQKLGKESFQNTEETSSDLVMRKDNH